ncbi:MAG: hypothetical protein LBJ70_04585 [Holosporales bacterium]|jgi:type VI secretion system protein|nr:hypothetical protein [Holosporales bacterium]
MRGKGQAPLYLGFLLIALGGCSQVPLETVSISASPEANSSYATMVDLVVLYDKDLAAKISAMPSSQYFQVTDQLLHDNGTTMSRWRWEIVPGQVITQCPITVESYGALAGFVFAGYYTAGDHRCKLTPVQDIAVLLDPEDFRVCALAENKGGGQDSSGKALPLPKISKRTLYDNAKQSGKGTPPAGASRKISYREIIRRRLQRDE